MALLGQPAKVYEISLISHQMQMTFANFDSEWKGTFLFLIFFVHTLNIEWAPISRMFALFHKFFSVESIHSGFFSFWISVKNLNYPDKDTIFKIKLDDILSRNGNGYGNGYGNECNTLHTENPDKRTQKRIVIMETSENHLEHWKRTLNLHIRQTMNDERKTMSEHLHWNCKCSLNCNQFPFSIVLIPTTESPDLFFSSNLCTEFLVTQVLKFNHHHTFEVLLVAILHLSLICVITSRWFDAMHKQTD